MKAATRQKAIRHLVSALLSGVFSEREIDDISSALIRRDDFVADLGSALRQVAQQLSEREKPGRKEPATEEHQQAIPPFEMAAESVKHLGITQRELLSIIEEISPEFAISRGSKRLPTAGILERFFRNQPADKRALLLKELTRRLSIKPTNGDSYLELITKKLAP